MVKVWSIRPTSVADLSAELIETLLSKFGDQPLDSVAVLGLIIEPFDKYA